MPNNLEKGERIKRLRVAVDLDDTLIFVPNPLVSEIPELRTGSTKLLEELRNAGLDVVLYTSASKNWVDYVFDRFPEIRRSFADIYYRENTPTPRRSRGIKDPSYVGADLFIDNYIDTTVKQRLGPKAIEVPRLSDVNTEEWADEAINRIRQILGG